MNFLWILSSTITFFPECGDSKCAQIHTGFNQRVRQRTQVSLSWFMPSSYATEASDPWAIPRGTGGGGHECCWKIIRSGKDDLWSACNSLVFQHSEMYLMEWCQLACLRLQEYMLTDALKLCAANMKALCGRITEGIEYWGARSNGGNPSNNWRGVATPGHVITVLYPRDVG